MCGAAKVPSIKRLGQSRIVQSQDFVFFAAMIPEFPYTIFKTLGEDDDFHLTEHPRLQDPSQNLETHPRI